MNKKGFTLIELVATIVILAVIVALIVPNYSKLFNKTKKIGGQDIENLLVENLKLYNTDKESQIWTEKSSAGDCYVMSYQELKSFNPEINLGDCLINSFDSLIIQKTDNGYGYFANITCSTSFTDPEKYLLEGVNTDDAYYRSNNAYTCNNLN